MTQDELRKLIEPNGIKALDLPDHERDLMRSFILNSPEWPIIINVIDHQLELSRTGSECQTDMVQVYRAQGVAMGLRAFLASMLQLCAPKVEVEAEREAGQHLRDTAGRDSGGGY